MGNGRQSWEDGTVPSVGLSFRKPEAGGRFRGFFLAALLLAGQAFLLAGCVDDDGFQIGTLRFGQVGEMRLTLVVPLLFNGMEGELQQILVWNSSGAWQLRESISYRGLPGDETVRRNQGGAGEYAAAYATRITQFNDDPVLRLFIPELPQGLEPHCGMGETRVTLLIRDDFENKTATWTRCSVGSLGTLNTQEAGPDPAAVRLIQAAILIRDFSLGDDFRSAYLGSIPFGTLDRGEDSGAELEQPRFFLSRRSGLLETPEGWVEFWRAHVEDPTAQPPVVDWAREMVLAAAAGKRTEAGDSVEIRRILQTGEGTLVTLFERVPGDFCSPAARDHFPVHIVVAPRTSAPIQFTDLTKEWVPCGF